jgi:Xaa-Pro aminopeptidase
MPALVLWGDTVRSAALRHELPLVVVDPFLFVDDGPGRRWVMSSALEAARLAEVRPDVQQIPVTDLGFRELLESGLSRPQVLVELASRMMARTRVREALVHGDLAVAVADRLRADGIALHVDTEAVDDRRRVKTPAELDGILRAQRAAEAGMAAAAAALREATAGPDGLLTARGEPVTAERVRAALRRACADAGCPVPNDVIVASVRQGFGHEPGSGPLPAGLPIQVDLWPQDEETGCWADMTRTFVAGAEPPAAVRAQEELVRGALEQVRAATRPGVTGRALHALVCDRFEAAGFRTTRTGPGDDPTEGMQFSLGHGVGLEVHESPGLGQTGHRELVAGDVVAIEPGLWDREVGGVRFEDLLLVTEDGCETLTRFPYELAP